MSPACIEAEEIQHIHVHFEVLHSEQPALPAARDQSHHSESGLASAKPVTICAEDVPRGAARRPARVAISSPRRPGIRLRRSALQKCIPSPLGLDQRFYTCASRTVYICPQLI